MLKRNIKLTIEYDGTNYYGWQTQPDALTIQQTIEDTISSITKENITIIGSGRTDSKVHAFGHVANFYTESTIPQKRFKNAINSFLPSDIYIKDSTEVSYEFHSRYHAIGKEYKYIIYNYPEKSTFNRNYSYHVPYKLNIEYMEKAIDEFIGTHNFVSFMASGSSIKNTVRTIKQAKIEKKEELIEITLQGSGFLYNMVRIIVGTLVDVGMQKIDYKDIDSIIKSKNRSLAGHTAPAQGLYLNKVFY